MRTGLLCGLKMSDRLLEVGALKLCPDEPAPMLESDDAFRSDAHEWGLDGFVSGAVKVQASLNNVELQRAQMALVLILARHANI